MLKTQGFNILFRSHFQLPKMFYFLFIVRIVDKTMVVRVKLSKYVSFSSHRVCMLLHDSYIDVFFFQKSECKIFE